MNIRYPEKRTRSANDPVISEGVMMANFIWNSANNTKGIVVVTAPISLAVSPFSTPTFPTPTLLSIKKSHGLPMMPPISSPNARPNPNTTQMTLTKPMTIKLCNIVDITFLARTMPP